MSTLPPYSIGTITLEQNSPAIVGNDTGWQTALVAGGVVYVAAIGNSMPLASVEDEDAATAAVPWKGASGTYQYAIVRDSAAAASIVDVNDRLAQILVRGTISSAPATYKGSLAGRGALDLGPDDDQVTFERMAPLEPWELYRWSGSGWIGPFSPQGPAGVGEGGYGLPAGGTTGQVPAKGSSDDGDVEWVTPADPEVEAADVLTDPAGTFEGVDVEEVLDDHDGRLVDLEGEIAEKADLTAVREKLTANRTYYVRTDGSDSNNGLANTSGGAFLTKQKALDVILGTLDLAGSDVDVRAAAGTYAGGISFTSPQVGKGNITFKGDTTTPSNVTVGPITVDGAGCRLFFEGLNVSKGAGQHCVTAVNGGYVKTTGLNQFSSTSSGHRLLASGSGVIEALANEIVQGTVAGAHYLAQNNGFINVGTSITWTASGTAAQGLGFAWAQTSGVIFAFLNTASGTFTGPRYSATMNGVVQSNGGGASYFPGNSTGSVATGGQYA